MDPSSGLQTKQGPAHMCQAELAALLDVLHAARGAHHDVHTLPQLAQLLADGGTCSQPEVTLGGLHAKTMCAELVPTAKEIHFLKHDAAPRHVQPKKRRGRLHAHIESGAGASHKH